MKETLKISDRFNLVKKLGQGTFSFIYEAYDKKLQKNVALKIEKKDKNKSILIFEYNVLNVLKGLSHVCNAYDFVKNSEQNLIVMDLLGNNLAKVRKCLEENYNLKIAIQLLIEMLDAIEEVHDRGFIHRDVKASNFVLSQDNRHVYIVDFGLAKKHLDEHSTPVAQRKKADFRGTVSFASLNAHNNIDLSRRDDIWSLYFVILDFLNEKLKWREQKEYTMDEVKNIKTECLNNPEEKLWIVTKDIPEVRNIFHHIQSLNYKDKPSYSYIRENLKNIYSRNMDITQSMCNNQQLPQRNNSCNIPHLLIQHQPQGNGFPYMQAQPGFNPKGLQSLQAPPVPVEFQTPERPSNHQRCLHQNLQNTPSTPQNNQSLGVSDEAAFNRASPNLNINVQHQQAQPQQQFNFPPFYVQNSNRKQQVLPQDNFLSNTSGTQSPQPRIHGIKRKAAEPLTLEGLRAASSNELPKPESMKNQAQEIEKQKQYATNQTKQGDNQQAASMRKRDTKKGQVNVIYDEEPLFPKPRIEGDMNTVPVQNGAPNGVFYQFTPSGANCVNQQININQNFFLSPPFIYFYNEQQDNLLSTGPDAVSSFTSASTQVSTRPNSLPPYAAPSHEQHMLNQQGLMNVYPPAQSLFNKVQPQQQPIYHNPMVARPGNFNPFFTTPGDPKPQGPFAISNQPKNHLEQPFVITKNQNEPHFAKNQLSADICQPRKIAASYKYDPSKLNMKSGPIFKVETDKDQFNKVYKTNQFPLAHKNDKLQEVMYGQGNDLRVIQKSQHPTYVTLE